MGEILLDLQEKEIIQEKETLNIKVVNTTNESLIYKILVGKDGVWETLRDFNDDSEIQWSPKDEGNYMIIAQAKKENSKKPFDYKVSQNIIVESKQDKLISKLVLDQSSLKIGEKITLSVDASINKEDSDSIIMYRYYISYKGGWQILKDYSAENKLTYTVNEGGYYEFLVECKVPESSNSFDDYKTIGFSVINFKKPEITNFKCLSEEVLVGNDLIFEVNANFEDERTALYKFIKIDPDGRNYCIQEYSSRRIVNFTEKQPGKYKLLCLIRDMYSSKEYDDRAIILYEVKPYRAIRLNGFTTDLTSPQVIGTNILIKASADGGNNLLYRFIIDGELGEDSGYIRRNSFEWKPKCIGNYTITVYVKDELFNGEYEVKDKLEYKVDESKIKPIKITHVLFNKDKDYLINEPINIKVKTDGGANIKYYFQITKNDVIKENISYGDANWVNFTPKEKGEYQLEIRVKDKYSEKEYDAHTILYFKVKEYIEGKIDHILVPSKGYFLVGDSIDIETICQNTDETLIKYVTKINEQTVEETEYIKSKKMSIMPKCAGKYVVDMYVKNIKCKNGFDTKKEVKFYVNDALPITNTKIGSNKTSYNVNEEITFITSSDGGVKVCYEYYIMVNGNWTLMQKYSRKNYYTFRPFTSGDYKVLVLTKSHYKKCAYEDYDTLEFKVD